jgi:large subunit ribosomal protein L17
MRHRLAGRHLGRETSHRTALYRNLVTDLLRYERITTTEAKAKEIRPMAERIITLGRRRDLHARRQALRFVYDPRVVKKVFDDIGPRMASRPGGYLRITGLEPRKGDGAKMATIELVDFVEAPPTPRPQRVTAAPSIAPTLPAGLVPAPAVEPAKLESGGPTYADEFAEETREAKLAEAGAGETEAEAEVGEADAPAAEAEEPAAEGDEEPET